MRRRRGSSIEIVFETHSTTVDNERWIASGWLDGRLSRVGKRQAKELGERRCRDELAAVFTSDLGRAVETTDLAFGGRDIPIYHDWRLRECNYGGLNGLRGCGGEGGVDTGGLRSRLGGVSASGRGGLASRSRVGRATARSWCEFRASSMISRRGSTTSESSSSAMPQLAGPSTICSRVFRCRSSSTRRFGGRKVGSTTCAPRDAALGGRPRVGP